MCIRDRYAAEDKKRREAVDVRNNADQMIYQTEKTVNEFGDKLSADEKAKIDTAKEALKEALKGEDIEAIKAKQEELQKELFAVSEKVYKAANPQGAENAQPQGGAQNLSLIHIYAAGNKGGTVCPVCGAYRL